MGNKQSKTDSKTNVQTLENRNKTEYEVYKTSIDALNARVLNRDDLELILECGKQIENIKNPYILILSHKSQNIKAIDESYFRQNIMIITAKTHKEMKEKIIRTLNLNKSWIQYDGIIVVLLAITEVFRIEFNGTEIIKYYYDTTNHRRHVDKLRKEIFYRMGDLHLYMHYNATVINSVYTSKGRPGAKCQQYKVEEIKKKVKKKLIAQTYSIIRGYCRIQNQTVLQVIFRFYRNEPFFLPDATVNDVLSDPELSMKIETSIAGIDIMTDGALSSFATILNENYTITSKTENKQSQSAHQSNKKSKTSASNNTSSNSNVHDINVDEKKNDKNDQDKKRSCPDSTKKKQKENVNDYFTQKFSSSFNDQQSTPLCTIYENQQNETNHSFRALQSAPNILNHHTCTNCKSLEKLIFEIMKENECWKQQTNIYLNELLTKENQIRDLNWLLNQSQLNNFQSTSIVSNNENTASQPNTSSSCTSINNYQQSNIMYPIRDNVNKDKAKKKKCARILTNQYTKNFGDYATYIPPQAIRAQGNIQIPRKLTSEIPWLIKEEISNIFAYIDTSTALQNNYEYNDGLIRIYNYHFHCIKDGKTLFCVAHKQNKTLKQNRGYPWRMENKLFTENEIENKYGIPNDSLPLSIQTTMQFENIVNHFHMTQINDIIKTPNFAANIKWNKIPVYSKDTKRRNARVKLSFTVEQFRKRLIPKKSKRIIPILMFRNDNICIQYIWMSRILPFDPKMLRLFKSDNSVARDCSNYIIKIILRYIEPMKETTDIGIAFECDLQLKRVRTVGIHLDKQRLINSYQLLCPQNDTSELDDFRSEYEDLQIGDVDYEENIIKIQKQRIDELKSRVQHLEAIIEQTKQCDPSSPLYTAHILTSTSDASI